MIHKWKQPDIWDKVGMGNKVEKGKKRREKNSFIMNGWMNGRSWAIRGQEDSIKTGTVLRFIKV